MKVNYRHILGLKILFLFTLLAIWADDLYTKQIGLLDYRYEVIKVLIHTAIAYKAAKLVISKLDLERRFKGISSTKLFLVVFLVFNSYIIVQYGARAVSNKVINRALRSNISHKTIELDFSGWGYESDSLTYKEYKELSKSTFIVDIPQESETIYIFDWHELDYRRSVEFNLPKDYNLIEFYKNDTTILQNISEIKNGDYLFRPSNEEFKSYRLTIDTMTYKRYKFKVSDS